ALALVTAAPQHLRAVLLPIGRNFLCGTGLADSRLAAQQDQAAAAGSGIVVGSTQCPHLVRAPDEGRVKSSEWSARHYAVSSPRRAPVLRRHRRTNADLIARNIFPEDGTAGRSAPLRESRSLSRSAFRRRSSSLPCGLNGLSIRRHTRQTTGSSGW